MLWALGEVGEVVILVVSPNEEIGVTLTAALMASGKRVEVARSTGDGLSRAQEARVVVLDLLTEESAIDGEAFRGLPNVVVISRHEEQPILIGQDRYSKAFSLQRLKDAVRAPINRAGAPDRAGIAAA